ncbi:MULTISPECIES: hypothetical protein [Gracilibacillus]|uniref:hypothetical protein n=1 Tax=Gracilibacillus TaxID=74385 RepID=UPI000824B33F|nr:MULTISPECIES: hypothetical protein [Gracilibacillus]
MKQRMILVITACSLLLLASCSDKEEIAEELIQYNNEVWVPINKMKETELNDLESMQQELESAGKIEEAALLVENEIVPVMDEVLDQLESADTANKEVDEWNDMQIEAEELAKDYMEESVDYYESDEWSVVDHFFNTEELKAKYIDVADYRDELIDTYELEYVKGHEGLGNFRDLKRAEE